MNKRIYKIFGKVLVWWNEIYMYLYMKKFDIMKIEENMYMIIVWS